MSHFTIEAGTVNVPLFREAGLCKVLRIKGSAVWMSPKGILKKVYLHVSIFSSVQGCGEAEIKSQQQHNYESVTIHARRHVDSSRHGRRSCAGTRSFCALTYRESPAAPGGGWSTLRSSAPRSQDSGEDSPQHAYDGKQGERQPQQHNQAPRRRSVVNPIVCSLPRIRNPAPAARSLEPE